MSKSRKLLLALTMVFAIIAGSSTAVLAGMTTPASVINNNLKVSGNYSWVGDATANYNCLAYALETPTSWIWPWGYSNPSSSTVDSYLSSKGYNYNQPMSSSNVANYEIISYGTSSSINHFARVASGGIGASNDTIAKWGTIELLKHSGWDPYKSNGEYGNAHKKFAK